MNSKFLFSIVALVVVAILQLALADMQAFRSAPNLVLVYVCISALFLTYSQVIWLAVIGGILLDFFSGLPDGIILISLVGGFALSNYTLHALFTDKLGDLHILFRVILGTIFFSLLVVVTNYLLLFIGMAQTIDWGDILTVRLSLNVVLNALALYPLYLLRLAQLRLENKFA